MESEGNVQTASFGQGGSSCLGFENLIKHRLLSIKGILCLQGGTGRSDEFFPHAVTSYSSVGSRRLGAALV